MRISFDHVFDFCEEIGQKPILTPVQMGDLSTIKGLDAVTVEMSGTHDGEFFQPDGLDAGTNVDHWLTEVRNHVVGVSANQILSINFLMIQAYNKFAFREGQSIALREYHETLESMAERERDELRSDYSI